MLKLNHKNLDVWKVTIKLAKEVYVTTKSFQEKNSLD